MFDLVWGVIGVLILLWLLGFSINLGGSLVHVLLVLALAGVVYNLFFRR